jgi:hypothetical protein
VWRTRPGLVFSLFAGLAALAGGVLGGILLGVGCSEDVPSGTPESVCEAAGRGTDILIPVLLVPVVAAGLVVAASRSQGLRRTIVAVTLVLLMEATLYLVLLAIVSSDPAR